MIQHDVSPRPSAVLCRDALASNQEVVEKRAYIAVSPCERPET